MRSTIMLAGLLAMTLPGCGQSRSDDPAKQMPGQASPPNPPIADPAPPLPSVPTAPPLPRPELKGPIDPKSVEAAAQVVQRFGALLEQRKFLAARQLWSGAGQANGLGEAQFIAAYDKYATIHAEVGPAGQSEGGAGSIYVDVPLRLFGTLRSGGRFDTAGPVSLRRVNGVDDATQAQLRWHIFQSALKPRP